MFNLHKIKLTNFRTYLGTHEFEFPTTNGLYFFTGENNAALGSNGAGKSTLLDAIVWALYGRTTRGLKAGEVISWGASTCQVVLELTVGDNRLTVKRSQKPNSLYLDDKPLDQKELEKHIRLNYDSFLYSVINPQFGVSFLSKSPSEKLTLFSDIMGLDYWLEKSENAADKSLQLERQVTNLTNHIDIQKERLQHLEEIHSTFQENANNFASQREERLSLKKKELARVTNDVISLDEKMADLNTENKERLRKAEATRDQWIDDVAKYAKEHAMCLGNIQSLKEQLQECQVLGGSTCPTCLQPVDKFQIQSRVKVITTKLEQRELELSIIKDDLEMVKKYLVKVKIKIDTIITELNEAKDKQMEAKLLHARMTRLEDELKLIKAEENPHLNTVEHNQKRINSTKKSIEIDTATKEKAEAEFEAVNFWVKGFKRVRLFIIEQAFRTLEIEVNNSLAQLGMSDWQITFDIERENKAGGITKGFVVFVKSPVNNEPVRWESWSGGETQRLQLAGDLGLANLIMQRAGLRNTIEFFDEPSTHLSQQGMMDLANLLHDRAITEGKRIWIVDHTSITNFGEFQGVITARKTANGSTITYNSN